MYSFKIILSLKYSIILLIIIYSDVIILRRLVGQLKLNYYLPNQPGTAVIGDNGISKLSSSKAPLPRFTMLYGVRCSDPI